MGEIHGRSLPGGAARVIVLRSSDVVPFSPALFSAAGKPIDASVRRVSFGASAPLLAVLCGKHLGAFAGARSQGAAGCSFFCGSLGSLPMQVPR